MGGFILGAIVGGAVVWFWGRDMRARLDDRTSGLRSRAADVLHSTADRLHSVGDTIEGGLGEGQQRAG